MSTKKTTRRRKSTSSSSKQSKLTEVNTNYARLAIILLALQTLGTGYLLYKITEVPQRAEAEAQEQENYLPVSVPDSTLGN